MQKINYRGHDVHYQHYVLDNTFVFAFGDGELIDNDEDPFFIQMSYELEKKKWTTEIFWEDEHATLEDMIEPEKYLTKEELKIIQKFAGECMDLKIA